MHHYDRVLNSADEATVDSNYVLSVYRDSTGSRPRMQQNVIHLGSEFNSPLAGVQCWFECHFRNGNFSRTAIVE